MPLPSESAIAAAVATLESYQSLRINGHMSEEALAAMELLASNNSAPAITEVTTTPRLDPIASGVINSLASSPITLAVGRGESSWSVEVNGTFVGVLQFEFSIGGVVFTPPSNRQTVTGTIGNKITAPGFYRGNCGGIPFIRLRASSWTSGAAEVKICAGGVGAVFTNTVLETRELAQYYSTAAGGRKSFNITSGAVTVNAASMMILAFSNPANSPIDLYIERITVSNSTNGLWTRVRNSTITPTGTPLVAQNRGGGDASSESRSYLTTTATVTGGNGTSSTHVAAYFPFPIEEDGALILRPGQNAVWSFAPVGSIGSATASVNVVWWEATLTT